MASNAAEVRNWARAEGIPIDDRGRIPREIREAYNEAHPGDEGPELLPSPDEYGPGDDDMDEISLEELEELSRGHGPPRQEPPPEAPRGWWETPGPAPDLGPMPADPPPAKLGKRAKGKAGAKSGPVKPTPAVAKDVHAKIRFILVPTAHLYRSRDPICGGVAVETEPEISASLAEIVLQSPDLLALFMGPGSAFMIYVRLFMACLPLMQTIFAHHVAHSIGGEPAAMASRGMPNPEAYAA